MGLLVPHLHATARAPGDSAAPGLRRHLVAGWCPALGAQGSRLLDWSGRGGHGTLANGASWGMSAPCGRVLSFGGGASFGSGGPAVTVPETIPSTPGVTIALLATIAASNSSSLFQRRNGSNQGPYILNETGGFLNINGAYSTISYAPPAGPFVLVVTYDGTTIVAWVGRAGGGAATRTTTAVTGALTYYSTMVTLIGNANGGGNAALNGSVGAAWVFGRALPFPSVRALIADPLLPARRAATRRSLAGSAVRTGSLLARRRRMLAA